SYAINMATQRWATAEGADDALWVSAEGYPLEGPTSTLVWRSGDELVTVPTTTGILAGTTAQYAMEHADQLGLRPATRLITVDDLFSADGAWLLSSVRGIAEIRRLDGTDLPASADTA